MNLQKTFTMSFRVNAMHKSWKPLKFDGQPILPKTEGQYLGMLFYTNKAFRQARRKLIEKAKSPVWAVHQLMLRSYMASTEAVQRVFTACIQSVVLYAVEVWGTGLSRSRWKTIQQIQNDFLKLHLGLKSSTCTATMLAKCGEYPMEAVALVRTARYHSRIQGMKDHCLPKQALSMLLEAYIMQQQRQRDTDIGHMAIN